MIIIKTIILNTMFCCYILILINTIAMCQPVNSTREQKIKQAGKAGEQFVKRFRETLDCGIVFDQMASDKAQKIVEKGLYKQAEIERTFYEKQNDKIKVLLFKNAMNYGYLLFAYELTFLMDSGTKKESFNIPRGYKKLIKKFSFVNGFSIQQSNPRGKFPIDNDQDLLIYLAELDTFNQFIRKHLPRKYYNLPNYKKNLKDTVLIPTVTVTDGDSYFEVDKGIEVFQVVRDMFVMDFIEENGQMKLLGLVIGN